MLIQKADMVPSTMESALTEQQVEIKINENAEPTNEEPKRNVTNKRFFSLPSFNTASIRVVLGNAILFATVAIGLLLSAFGVISPGYPAFLCQDPALTFPFEGDTVTSVCLVGVTALVPFPWLFLVEYSQYLPNETRRWRLAARRAGKYLLDFVLGILFCYVLVDMTKGIVAEPRPHFFDTCKPNITGGGCMPGTYVTNYTCTGGPHIKPWLVRDSRRSFPSGHATVSMFLVVYLASHLQKRLVTNLHLLRPWLHIVLMTWAIVCSVTRITDHRHHWWDVLVGLIYGALAAVYTVRYLSKNFRSTSTAVKPAPENGIVEQANSNHTSVRHLLTSTSSYSSATVPDRDVN